MFTVRENMFASFTVTAVGDMCLGGILPKWLIDAPKKIMPESIKSELAADCVFGNLESPFSEKGLEKSPKHGFLFADPSAVKILKRGGFNIVSLANNHICDCGYEGMFYTMELLRDNDIKYCGVGHNLDVARKPALLNIGGTNIAVHAYIEQGFGNKGKHKSVSRQTQKTLALFL